MRKVGKRTFSNRNYVTMGPMNSDKLQQNVHIEFAWNKAAFDSNANGTACGKINFVQIAHVNISGALGLTDLTAIAASWFGGIPIDQWAIDGGGDTTAPYYNPQGRSTGSAALPWPAVNDGPGVVGSSAIATPFVSSLTCMFETVAVCSASNSPSGKGVGDVFGAVQWGFSINVTGPAWNRRVSSWSMYVAALDWDTWSYKPIMVVTRNGSSNLTYLGG